MTGRVGPLWRAAVEAEKAAGRAEKPLLSVIEVNFKKPQPGQSLEMTWAPSRGLIAAQVGRMTHCRLEIYPIGMLED